MITEEQKEKDRDLEGKEVKVMLDHETLTDAIVTGIDWDLGITIQAKNDNRYLLCHNGPSSPISKRNQIYNLENHDKIYSAIVAMIRKGKIDLSELWHEITLIKEETPGNSPSAETCPFSQ